MNGSPTICHKIGEQSRVCLIRGVRFELFVIGYPRDFHVNYMRFNNDFLHKCFFLQFSKLRKRSRDVSAQNKFPDDILIPNFVIDTIS